MSNRQINFLLTCKIPNHVLKKLKSTIEDFKSDWKFLMNIFNEQKWHENCLQPVNLTDELGMNIKEPISENNLSRLIKIINSTNSSSFFHQQRINKLNIQTRIFFSSENILNDGDLSVTKNTDPKDDISAWQEVGVRTKEHLKKLAEISSIPLKDKEKSIIKFSILPEPPNPKKDIAIVNASDIKKITNLKKILDPAILSDQNDDLPSARIILHELYPNETSTSSSDEKNNQIIFDRLKVQILNDPNSILNTTSSKKN